MTKQQIQSTSHSCSFCGKKTNEVELMIAGPRDADICNECVWLCVNALLGKLGNQVVALPKKPGGDQ